MNSALAHSLAALSGGDRALLRTAGAVALLALILGILGGLLTGLTRAGLLDVAPIAGYRFLTLHGVSIFFYWLFIAQAALLLGFAAAEASRGLALRPLAWGGLALMLGGFLLSLAGAHMGIPLLYDGAPELAAGNPRALLIFNLGYLALGAGLMSLPVAAIATLLRARAAHPERRLSAVGFALFAWAGFLIVTGFAAIYTFLPGAAWALGLGEFPSNHGTNWHIVFHNMHYLPLMATVIMWYVLVRHLTGVKSIFGERLSKIVFAMYLVFVPPTSLYHMFLEPDLPGVVRLAGSLLSLFVSVPTLTAFLIVVASLEVHARTRGGSGVFGWLRALPWRQPAMNAIAVAMLSMGLGIVFAFVLIQEKLAPLLSDTFFVPGYFHFFTVGTVSLTLLAALGVLFSAIGRPPVLPAAMRSMPWLALTGLLIFGAAGVAAGYLGAPRRVMHIGYQGAAPELWQSLMSAIGVGSVLMAAALLVLALGVAASLLPRRAGAGVGDAPVPAWDCGAAPAARRAWFGPLAVTLIVLSMYAFTIVGFELLQALPVTASGGAGH